MPSSGFDPLRCGSDFHDGPPKPAAARRPTVVVPVFDGWPAVETCIESLLETTPADVAIRIIDDASTDPRLLRWLDALAKRCGERLRLVRNPSNKGYLKTVNEALETIAGDIVVANSDTRFTPDWLGALAAAAADPVVGIANPISDNATILSVPELNNASAQTLAELREAFGSRWYELPTAVGFCMYIKRETIERVGTFDLLFDPGYGEECDYSMRVRRAGLKIAAVPSAVVFHQGSQSFGEGSIELRRRHEQLLSLRWPAYQREVLQFSRWNPIRAIREFIAGCESKAPTRVLHVLHELDYLGGIELFTKELLGRFSPDSEHLILCPGRVEDPWADFSETRIAPNVRAVRFDPRRTTHPNVAMNIPAGIEHGELDRMFLRIAASGRFNCVHFHTLVRLGTLSWPMICKALELPYFVFMHEFFHLCHDYNMIFAKGEGQPCGKVICHEQDDDCLACMGSRFQSLAEPLPQLIRNRRVSWQEILDGAERVFTNGPLVTGSVTRAYGSALRPSIREFEPFFFRRNTSIAPVELSAREPLHVAYLGAFSLRKGGGVFLAAAGMLAGGPYRFRIIGNAHDAMRDALEQSNIPWAGAYLPSQLDELLADVDLVVQASIWQETYSITLSEAWERGRPVVAPANGAYLDRVRHGENGWLYPPGDARALASLIEYLGSGRGRDELERVAQGLRNTPHRDNPIAVELEAFYARYPRRCRLAALARSGTGPNALPPSDGAQVTTRKWLDQAMCLEAADDWADPGEVAILAAEDDDASPDRLKASLNEHAPQARMIALGELEDLPAETVVILLQGDTVVTANAGNWVAAWRACGKPFATCNYLLHGSDGEPHSPLFRGPGDRTFPDRQPRRWVGLIGEAGRIGPLLAQASIEDIAAVRLDELVRADDLAHFDGCALSMLDRRWASLWKADLAEAGSAGDSATLAAGREARIGVIVQGGSGPGMRRLQSDLAAQEGVNLAGVVVLLPAGAALPADTRRPGNVRVGDWNARDPAESINRAVRTLPPVDYLVFVADNVHIHNRRLLQSMLGDMVRYRLPAASPFVPSDRRGDAFVARRAGCGGRGLVAYGPPASTPFDVPGVPLAADFLDDDFFLVRRDAWRDIGGMPAAGQEFYRAVMLSERLRAAGFFISRCPQFVRKAALPSAALDADASRQPREREEVLRALTRSRAPSAWSQSMSLQPPYGLEYRQHAFKGGGRLPRVLAYAHDVWASGFYRVRAPAAALAAAGKASCHFLPEQRERRVPNVMEVLQSGASVLVLHSFLHDAQLEKLADYHRFLDIPVVFSLDDWLLELPRYNPFSKTNYPDMARRVRYALDHCDRLIVPTRRLAEYYARFVSDIRVVPNRIPRALIRAPRQPRQGKLRVGWAGAPQHAGDLDWLAPVVQQTGEHCRWVFFGQKPAGLAAGACEFHPAVGLKAYFEKLAGLDLDLAVAPLSDNPFNRAKSPLKLLEYASLGLPVVCSDCEAYRDAPALKLGNDAALWVRELVRLAEQPDTRADLAAGLRQWLEDNHVLEDHLDEWGRALYLHS